MLQKNKIGPYLTLLCLNGQGAEAAWLSVLGKAWRAGYVDHEVQQNVFVQGDDWASKPTLYSSSIWIPQRSTLTDWNLRHNRHYPDTVSHLST